MLVDYYVAALECRSQDVFVRASAHLDEQLLKQNLMGRLGLLRDTGHSRKTPFTTAFYPEQSVLTFGDAASLSVTR
jgi:hypothetical protein